MSSEKKVITIVGPGKVGGSIIQRLRNIDEHDLVSVSHKGFERWLDDPIEIGNVLILAIKDAGMRDAIDQITTRKGASLEGATAFHVNGSIGKDMLKAWEGKGAHIGAAHPFQTFSEIDPSALDNIGWGVDATDAAWPQIKELVETLGGNPRRLSDTSDLGKRRYHASAVAASNFAYAAYELGRRLAESVDIDPQVFLVPIMKRTFENAADDIHDEEPFSVTGPLVRGDVEGVRKQLASMPDEDKAMYCHLSRALLEVVKDRLGPQVTEQLISVLDTSHIEG